jgi:hypothetical protein
MAGGRGAYARKVAKAGGKPAARAELLAIHLHPGPARTAPLHPQLKKLLALWSEKCGARATPSRADFPTLDMRPWLDHVALLEPAIGGLRFRIGGAALTSRFGRAVAGVALAGLAPDLRKGLYAMLDLAAAKQAPVAAACSIRFEGRRTLYSELLLPLAASRGAPAALLLGCYPVTAVP